LLQCLQADGEKVYRDLNFDFRPRWFPVLHLLSQRKSLPLTGIARQMDVAHPSLIETVADLISAGLVKSRKSDQDRRIRGLSLTSKGKRLCRQLLPVWKAFRIAGEEVTREGGNDFLKAVSILEDALSREPMYNRIMAKIKDQSRQKRKKRI
jgi:DNA-binding MarR family transcriptional regulator